MKSCAVLALLCFSFIALNHDSWETTYNSVIRLDWRLHQYYHDWGWCHDILSPQCHSVLTPSLADSLFSLLTTSLDQARSAMRQDNFVSRAELPNILAPGSDIGLHPRATSSHSPVFSQVREGNQCWRLLETSGDGLQSRDTILVTNAGLLTKMKWH